MKEQLVQAIAAARAGEREKAELLLQQVLKANPRGRELTETLYWLGLLATDLTEKRRYLTHVVRLDPQHERANKQLEKLPPRKRRPKRRSRPRSQPKTPSARIVVHRSSFRAMAVTGCVNDVAIIKKTPFLSPLTAFGN